MTADPTPTPEQDEAVRHRLLMPPHPGGVYRQSALCSCGEWQWDGDSTTLDYGAVLYDHTQHALATPPPATPDWVPEGWPIRSLDPPPATDWTEPQHPGYGYDATPAALDAERLLRLARLDEWSNRWAAFVDAVERIVPEQSDRNTLIDAGHEAAKACNALATPEASLEPLTLEELQQDGAQE